MNFRILLIAVVLALVAPVATYAQTDFVYDRERPLKDQAEQWLKVNDLRRLDLLNAPTSDKMLLEYVAGITPLREFALRSHRITEKGFVAIATLKNLRSLEFGSVGEGKSEELFNAISDLPLVELRLNNGSINSLEGFGQLRCRDTLRRLEIIQDRKDLGDKDLPKLAAFTELRHLDLSGNTKIKKGIKHLTGLAKLESLKLYGVPSIDDAELTKLFKHTPNLTHLNLGFCWWHKGEGLVFPASLTHLNLIESKTLTDAAFTDFPCRDSLIEANLFQCLVLTDKAIQAFEGAKRIERLNVGCIRALTNESLEIIGGLDTLTHLNISDNDTFDDIGLKHLAGLTRLRSLNLWHSRGVTGPGLKHLAKMHALVELNLADCKNIEDAGVIAIAKLPALEQLYLNNCIELTDQAITALAGHKRLKELTLSGCVKLTDASLRHMMTMRSLEYLELRGCHELSDEAVTKLRKALPGCRVVH